MTAIKYLFNLTKSYYFTNEIIDFRIRIFFFMSFFWYLLFSLRPLISVMLKKFCTFISPPEKVKVKALVICTKESVIVISLVVHVWGHNTTHLVGIFGLFCFARLQLFYRILKLFPIRSHFFSFFVF